MLSHVSSALAQISCMMQSGALFTVLNDRSGVGLMLS